MPAISQVGEFKMVVRTLETLPSLYEQDETAWLEAMAQLVREGRLEELDYANLSEYLLDMARRDKREVKSRLAVLLAHLLKWERQPERRSGSWRSTIEVQRQELIDLLESGALRNHAAAILAKAYADGVRQVVAETQRPAADFPTECPFTLDQLLDEELLAE